MLCHTKECMNPSRSSCRLAKTLKIIVPWSSNTPKYGVTAHYGVFKSDPIAADIKTLF